MYNGVKKVDESVTREGRTYIYTIDKDPDKIPFGSLKITNDGDLQYVKNKDGKQVWEKFNFSNIFDGQKLNDTFLSDNSINGEKLTNNSIRSDKLVDKCLDGNKIKDNTIKTNHISELDAAKIKDKSIITKKIADNSITTNLLADNCINSSKILDKAITADKIADGNINMKHLSNGSVSKNKIVSLCIDHDLLAENSVDYDNLKKYCVKNINLDNDSVTFEKIKDNSVYGSKIKNYAIKDIHINDVDGSKINENSISSIQLKDDAVTSSKISNNSVSFSKLSSDLQNTLNNSVKIQNELEYNDVQYLNTAHINGNVLLANSDSDCNLTVNGSITASGDITGSRVFNPYFSDIAEAYVPTDFMVEGDPVCLSLEGNLKIEKLSTDNYERFIGFISDNYASVFGATKEELSSGKKIPVALIGRIPVKLGFGYEATIGDYITIIPSLGTIGVTKEKNSHTIGRLLENKPFAKNKVLCQVWP